MRDLLDGALGSLRYEPTEKHLRTYLDVVPVADTVQGLLVWEPRRLVPTYAVPHADFAAQLKSAGRIDDLADLLRVGDALYLHAIINRGYGNVVWTENWRSDDSAVSWRRVGGNEKFRPACTPVMRNAGPGTTTPSAAGSMWRPPAFSATRGSSCGGSGWDDEDHAGSRVAQRYVGYILPGLEARRGRRSRPDGVAVGHHTRMTLSGNAIHRDTTRHH
jgi:hypothetical protein